MKFTIDFEYESIKDGFAYCIKEKFTKKELVTSDEVFESPRDAIRAGLRRLNAEGLTNIHEAVIEREVLQYRDTKWPPPSLK